MDKIIKTNKFSQLRNLLKLSKKGQLGIIEAKFLMIGLVIGIIVTVVLVLLANKGVLPFKLTFLCPSIK